MWCVWVWLRNLFTEALTHCSFRVMRNEFANDLCIWCGFKQIKHKIPAPVFKVFIYFFHIRRISKNVHNLRTLFSYHFNDQNSNISLWAWIRVLTLHIMSAAPRKNTKWTDCNKIRNEANSLGVVVFSLQQPVSCNTNLPRLCMHRCMSCPK